MPKRKRSSKSDSSATSARSSRSSKSRTKHTEQEEKNEEPIFSECESHQLLRELKKEEMTLKQLIYEFSEELKKTKFEEGILRDMIAKLSNGEEMPPLESKFNQNVFMMHDDNNNNNGTTDSNHNHNHNQHQSTVQAEEVDGDLMLKELLEDALNAEDIN